MDDGTHLKSVNWTTGMLLSPNHFRRQDAFLEETVGWLLQYCVPGTGLVGAGVRTPMGERGLSRFDPRIDVSDNGDAVSVSVLEVRGLTGLGQLIDIGRGNTIRGSIRRADLAGLNEALLYVVHGGDREEDPESIGIDQSNPTQAAFRRAACTVRVGSDADTLPHALCVGRIKRQADSLGFELDPRFIPACATMLGHSQLYARWKELHAAVVALSQDFAELHRKCATYIAQVAQRGADVSHDRDILAFLERAVLGIDHCAYATFDATITPDTFFREIDRAGRRVALALDLSESTRLYFADLGEADATYSGLLEQERTSLMRPRELASNADLQLAVDRAELTVQRVRSLGDALDARYTDYRLSRSIESLKFLLDGDGEQFFLAVASPGHPQRQADALTFVFSQLTLTARQRYRLVFIADQQAQAWQPGELIRVDVSLNPGSFDMRPTSYNVACVLPGQRNFSVDFEPDPALASLTALQVTVQPGFRIRGSILYQRKLGMRGSASIPVVQPPPPMVASSAPLQVNRELSPPPLPPQAKAGPVRVTFGKNDDQKKK